MGKRKQTRCVYCGRWLNWGDITNHCEKNPNGKTHLATSDGIHCIYCGTDIRTVSTSGACVYSPDGYHKL